ncbi:cytochrome c oxidase assembly protein [Thermoflavimicrobium dichotomicum]|uniref:Putative membrane protein n=1 Tax=Thermoflavimicrobium dichotomicum TaxID=46223 RepID=A0A1I3PDD0_9BACL|nr:cytochrome c oxidase assembly protein [Thermoflavimicrobium dichotomicum]SFJ19472.1 putative membrane protein [Thermoflavimicrobium dichotomicum]
MNINNHIHHGDGIHIYLADGIVPQLLLALPFVLALVMYILAAVVSSSRYKQWPLYRYAFWIFGILCAAATVVGPLANRAHIDFTAHMIGHLLLGMLAPLLLVLAAPMTLALRILNVNSARCLSRILKSCPVRILSDPIVASLLNVGGLWVLYTTDLYVMMQQNIILHVLVHIHVFFASYLFTVSMIYIDPTPHRTNFVYRAIVLVIALAGHGILSKYIYVHPPSNVPIAQAETGALLMYYGGDAIDLVLIFILCFQWFRATRPRASLSMSQSVNS